KNNMRLIFRNKQVITSWKAC
ncbi:hypothetical protein AZ032_001472, partial [Klebsiella pneumoniae]